ncbi:hypothetical protein CEXT_714531 [Caerostris extrusa]|uniref:Uncharacterized protein n=1 Tax=Caerostris extrusa TaxID=172846 RepID=A0AAV4PQQ6_CAEEX|nr:hypothetical protein CEXT_714531 [Caerostris extrusa]
MELNSKPESPCSSPNFDLEHFIQAERHSIRIASSILFQFRKCANISNFKSVCSAMLAVLTMGTSILGAYVTRDQKSTENCDRSSHDGMAFGGIQRTRITAILDHVFLFIYLA